MFREHCKIKSASQVNPLMYFICNKPVTKNFIEWHCQLWDMYGCASSEVTVGLTNGLQGFQNTWPGR